MVLAEILLCKAGTHILRTNYIRASITLRKSWKLYLRCEKLDPHPHEQDSETTKEIRHRLLFGKGTALFAQIRG